MVEDVRCSHPPVLDRRPDELAEGLVVHCLVRSQRNHVIQRRHINFLVGGGKRPGM